MRRGMRARSEGNARIQADVEGVGHGRFIPARYDPQTVAYFHGAELRLRDAYPIGIRHRRIAFDRGRINAQLFGRSPHGAAHVKTGFVEKLQTGTGPGLDFRLQPRFAVKRFFIRAVGVGVFGGDA